MKRCNECGGMGEVQDLEVRQYGRYVMLWAICPSCRGTGYTPEPPPAAFLMQTQLFDAPVIVSQFAAEGGAR